MPNQLNDEFHTCVGFVFRKKNLFRLIWLCMLTLADVNASHGPAVANCQSAVTALLASPTKRTLSLVSGANDEACWTIIAASNDDLSRLNHRAEQGDHWAAEYLAQHLKKLYGGNLEDALRALGQFSDHDMEGLLFFGNRELLSKHELVDALTMLPLSMSDEPKAQLNLLEARRSRIMRIRRTEVSEQKAQALKAIDDFISEITHAPGTPGA